MGIFENPPRGDTKETLDGRSSSPSTERGMVWAWSAPSRRAGVSKQQEKRNIDVATPREGLQIKDRFQEHGIKRCSGPWRSEVKDAAGPPRKLCTCPRIKNWMSRQRYKGTGLTAQEPGERLCEGTESAGLRCFKHQKDTTDR